MGSPPNYPDGLTQAIIDALIAEVDAVAQPVRRVPPLFADRDAAWRRECRNVHRAFARVTRSLPLVVPVVTDGEVA
jgi:hypothetical protein